MISKQISSLNISKNAFDFVNFLNSSSNLSDDSFETPSIFFNDFNYFWIMVLIRIIYKKSYIPKNTQVIFFYSIFGISNKINFTSLKIFLPLYGSNKFPSLSE